MARHANLAEHYRTHAQAFALAQELGCTPREAEAVMAQRAARDRWQEAKSRLDSRMAATPAPRASILQADPAPTRPESRDEPWMLRD